MSESTISGNVANEGGGVNNVNQSTAYVSNSTISDNHSDDDGGGIYNDASSTFWTYNATIAFNEADANFDEQGGSGGGVYNTGSFNPRNSVIAGNYHAVSPDPDDCAGTMTGFGFNKLGDDGGCTIFHAGACGGSDTPLGSLSLLGPLQFNGGPTRTHAILAGSGAVDGVAWPCICQDQSGFPVPSDQRGGSRPIGVFCDIGAFEYGALQEGLIFADGFELGNLWAWG